MEKEPSSPARGPLAGRYRIDARLGTGGMGTVYRGTDLTTGRTVALKVLHANLASLDEFLKRFDREARVMAALSHPNLLQLLAVERHEDVPFLVMPFIEGLSLRAHLKNRTRLTGREALPILAQLCAGLGYLHSRGIVHRDVKPDNVLLSTDGHVTLLDFGLSRKGGPSDFTAPGMLLGTARYMAPEQALDQPVDYRADLYALGLVTYHLLTGNTPFGVANLHATISRHIFDTPELASRMSPAVSDAVAAVLAQALSKEPAARHRSAQAFFDDFAAAFSLDATAQDTRTGQTERRASSSVTELAPVRPLAGGEETKADKGQKALPLLGKVKRFLGGD